MTKLDRIRELAQKATPSPWVPHPNPRYWVLFPEQTTHPALGDPNRDNNAAYVASLDPQTVLAMIEVIEAANMMREIMPALPAGRGGLPRSAMAFDAALAKLEQLT